MGVKHLITCAGIGPFVGADYAALRNVDARIELANADVLLDKATNKILTASWPLTLDEAGGWSVSLPSSSSSDYEPLGIAYQLIVDYQDGTDGFRQKRFTSDAFEVTAAADFTDVTFVALRAVDGQLVANFNAGLDQVQDAVAEVGTSLATALEQAEQIRDEQVDLSNIDDTDDAVSALLKGTAGTGVKTRAELTATYASRARVGVAISTHAADPIAGGIVMDYSQITLDGNGVYGIAAQSGVNYWKNFANDPSTSFPRWQLTRFVTGDIAVKIFTGAPASAAVLVYVDDDPEPLVLTGAPQATFWARVTVTGVIPRKVRIIGQGAALFGGITRSATTDLFRPGTTKLVVPALADSWGGGAANVAEEDLWPNPFGEYLGVDVTRAGQGGTGYTRDSNPGVRYGNPTRVARFTSMGAYDGIIYGSQNDGESTKADIKAAALAMYQDILIAAPTMRLHIIGPNRLPDGTTNLGTGNSNVLRVRDALREAAAEATNVLTFVDPIADGYAGDATAIPAWAPNTTYAKGAHVTANTGVVYRAVGSFTSGSTFDASKWTTLTWFTGTGDTTIPVGDGNSDYYFAREGNQRAHLSAAGHRYFARRVAERLRGRFSTTPYAALPYPALPNPPGSLGVGIELHRYVASLTPEADAATVTKWSDYGTKYAPLGGSGGTKKIVGSDAYITLPSVAGALATSKKVSGPVTIGLVARIIDANKGASALQWTGGGVNGGYQFYRSSSSASTVLGGIDGNGGTVTRPGSAVFAVVVLVLNGTASTIRIAGSTSAAGTTGAAAGDATLRLAAIDLAELVVIDGALSTANQDTLVTALTNRHNALIGT